MKNFTLPGSGNSLVGPRDDAGYTNLPKGYCICSRCNEITIDATDDGEGLCEVCLQAVIEANIEAQELLQHP